MPLSSFTELLALPRRKMRHSETTSRLCLLKAELVTQGPTRKPFVDPLALSRMPQFICMSLQEISGGRKLQKRHSQISTTSGIGCSSRQNFHRPDLISLCCKAPQWFHFGEATFVCGFFPQLYDYHATSRHRDGDRTCGDLSGDGNSESVRAYGCLACGGKQRVHGLRGNCDDVPRLQQMLAQAV